MKFYRRIPTKWKGDFYPLFFLLLLFSLLVVLFVGRQGSALTDCFAHGAFIPSQILEGKLLIRDVPIPYPPFSYQCHAFFLWVFGVHLNTIYGLGIVIAFLILLAFYFIARSLTAPWTAWAICFLIMTLCIFHYWIFNYIFPYAPAMLYALGSLLLSLLCCISYIQNSRPKILLLSFLFLGVSLASKFDFL